MILRVCGKKKIEPLPLDTVSGGTALVRLPSLAYSLVTLATQDMQRWAIVVPGL